MICHEKYIHPEEILAIGLKHPEAYIVFSADGRLEFISLSKALLNCSPLSIADINYILNDYRVTDYEIIYEKEQ